MSCSSDDQSDKECPLCMEPLEIDDVDFYPCKCEYQICRFCWHRLKNDENGLCPACRQPYPEDPVNFKPLSSADLQRIRDEKKMKQQAEKLRVSESRKHLANFRVLQKNLVYVVGLSPKVASEEILKKPEFFGRFGKILKIVTGTSASATLPAHLQPSHTAYVTYSRVEEALKAIQAVNNTSLDGRIMKASLGTTKYCSSFLRSQTCGKSECMYLHDTADSDISFTKEDMHNGKHTEYEKKLIETVLRKGLERKMIRNACWDQNGKEANDGTTDGCTSGGFGDGSGEDGCIHEPEPALLSSEKAINDKENHESAKTARLKSKQTRQNSPRSDHPSSSSPSQSQVAGDSSNAPISAIADTSSHTVIDSSVRATGMCSISDDIESQRRRDEEMMKCFASDAVNGVVPAPAPRDEAPAPFVNWQTLLGLDSQSQNSTDLKNKRSSSPPGFGGMFSDDELGFDPFSESTKGLAKLLEEERIRHHQPSASTNRILGAFNYRNRNPNGHNTIGTPAAVLQSQRGSLRDLWSQPVSNHPLGLGSLSQQHSLLSQHHSQPPFDMFGGVLPQQQYMSNYMNGMPHQQSQAQHLPSSQPSAFSELIMPPSHPLMSHQSSLYTPPPGLAPPVSRPTPPPLSMAEWQEGLKALLPNVNVRFASDMEPRWPPSHQSLNQVPPPPGFSVHNR